MQNDKVSIKKYKRLLLGFEHYVKTDISQLVPQIQKNLDVLDTCIETLIDDLYQSDVSVKVYKTCIENWEEEIKYANIFKKFSLYFVIWISKRALKKNLKEQEEMEDCIKRFGTIRDRLRVIQSM